MYECDRCGGRGTDESAYCQFCGYSRVVEWLRALQERPEWLPTLRVALGALILAWFLVTVGVAFLREAKALRRGREALEAGKPETALEWLAPFVAKHPQSDEGLVLAATAAVRLRRVEEARQYHEALKSVSGERSGEVERIFREAIVAALAQIDCSSEEYQRFYEQYLPLGDEFVDDLRNGAGKVIRRCFAAGEGYTAFQLGHWLLEETSDPSLVTGVYVEAVKGVLADGKYGEAAALVHQATRWDPEVGSHLHSVFDEVRGQTRTTVEQIKALVTRLQGDSRHKVGRFWCFPPTLAGSYQTLPDGWGRPVMYTPLSHDETIQCYQGFELVSLGADGSPTPEDRTTPAADIAYSFIAGQERWTLPDRYWFLDTQ